MKFEKILAFLREGVDFGDALKFHGCFHPRRVGRRFNSSTIFVIVPLPPKS